MPYNDGARPDPGRLENLSYGADPCLDSLMCEAAATVLPAVQAYKKHMTAEEIDLLDLRLGNITYGGAALIALWKDKPKQDRPKQVAELRSDQDWTHRPEQPRNTRAPAPVSTLPRPVVPPMRPFVIYPPFGFMRPGQMAPPFTIYRPVPSFPAVNDTLSSSHVRPLQVDVSPSRHSGVEPDSWPGNATDPVRQHEPGFANRLA